MHSSLDQYVDWVTARAILLDVRKAVDDALQLCTSILIKADAIPSSDNVLSQFLDNIELTDEQVLQISELYTKLVANIKFAADSLSPPTE